MQKYLIIGLTLLLTNLLLAQSDTTNTAQKRKLFKSDSTKSGYKGSLKMVNPTNKDVEMQLNDFAAPYYRYDLKYSNGWFDFKKRLNEKAGIQLSVNYSSIYMGATSKIAEENVSHAASGIFDATIKWTFLNRKKGKNQGSLVFWTDWRHLYYGDVTPQLLFLETGSGTMGATKFGKWKFHVLEFYYQQSLFNDRVDIVIGKIDMPDWFNFNGLAHPMLHFTDLAFSVSPTVSWSNPGFGIAAGGWLDKKKTMAIVAGLNDVAGVDLANPAFLDFGTDQWKNGNFLKMVEFQYTPGRSKYYYNRIAATFWQSDELMATDESYFTSPSSKGFNIQGTWVIDDRMVPTAAFGMSDGDGANTLSTVNIALANAWWFPNHDLLGVGLNYSKSSISEEGQVLSEVFYRWTLSKTTAFTPVVKFVLNPSLDPNTSVLMYFGLRGRVSF